MKGIEVRYDEKDTLTQYTFVKDKWLPLRVVDCNGNLLEEYFYSKLPGVNGYLQRVRFRNVKTGEWIELNSLIPDADNLALGGYGISVNGQDTGTVDWFKIGVNTIKIGRIDIAEDKRGGGIGLSIINWIAKWVKDAEQIDRIVYITQNPLMLNILDEIAEVYNETYNYCRELEYDGFSVNRRLEVLTDCSYFCVGGKGGADTFRATDYMVSIENGFVRHSDWDELPEGTYVGRLNVLSDWTITLDGKEIGQVKRFDRLLSFLGVTDPIRIYIDENGEVIRY
ncbi:MAG: hypothetical protein PHQ54_05730 [Candidatus Omnitrophica bacterium]|nr:hypothetical protein [Candidatus Omnitrophota bacterium]